MVEIEHLPRDIARSRPGTRMRKTGRSAPHWQQSGSDPNFRLSSPKADELRTRAHIFEADLVGTQ